jgi:hypothetical protein
MYWGLVSGLEVGNMGFHSGTGEVDDGVCKHKCFLYRSTSSSEAY